MSKYGSESRNRNKLLVPIVVLLLSTMALVGAGYAALTSTASNSNNEVGSSFIILGVTGDESVTVSGDALINYGTATNEDGITYYVESQMADIGKGSLEVDASNYVGSGAQLSYKVLIFDSSNEYVEYSEEALKYIEGFKLEIKKSGESDPITMNENVINTNIESGETYEFTFTLKAVFISGVTSGIVEVPEMWHLGEDEPVESFKYKIIFTVGP